jgi:hypothetical protein
VHSAQLCKASEGWRRAGSRSSVRPGACRGWRRAGQERMSRALKVLPPLELAAALGAALALRVLVAQVAGPLTGPLAVLALALVWRAARAVRRGAQNGLEGRVAELLLRAVAWSWPEAEQAPPSVPDMAAVAEREPAEMIVRTLRQRLQPAAQPAAAWTAGARTRDHTRDASPCRRRVSSATAARGPAKGPAIGPASGPDDSPVDGSAAAPDPAPCPAKSGASPGLAPRAALAAFLRAADLEHRLDALHELGAESVAHLADVREADLDAAGFKVLEKRRLLRAIAQGPSPAPAAPGT